MNDKLITLDNLTNYNEAVKSQTTKQSYQLADLVEYSSSSTYAVGDYVYYNDLIYKCNTAISTPEDFDNTKWTQKSYNEYLDENLGTSKQDIIQYSTMPTASISNVGKIVQYIGATNSTYTNGYFYECVSDGELTPTYSWTAINVQASQGGASKLDDLENVFVLDGVELNSQTYYTNRIDNIKAIINYYKNNPNNATYILFSNPTSYNSDIVYTLMTKATSIYEQGTSQGFVNVNLDLKMQSITSSAIHTTQSWRINGVATDGTVSTLTKWRVQCLSRDSQFFANTYATLTTTQTISGTKTFSTLPESSVTPTTANQLVNKSYADTKQDIIQYSVMPTASANTVGKIIQYTGTTDNTYTNGYFYIGVTDGESTPTYSWDTISVESVSKLDDLENVVVFSDTILATGNNFKQTITGANVKPLTKLIRYAQKHVNNYNFLDKPVYIFFRDLTGGSPAVFKLFDTWVSEQSNVTYVQNTFINVNIMLPSDLISTINNGVGTITQNCAVAFEVQSSDSELEDLTKNITKCIIKYGNGGTNLFSYLGTAQTITAKKTFSVLPESSVVPSTDDQLVNKKYVDDAIASAISTALGGN